MSNNIVTFICCISFQTYFFICVSYNARYHLSCLLILIFIYIYIYICLLITFAHNICSFTQALRLAMLFVLLPQSLHLLQHLSPSPISCRLEPHVHLHSSLLSVVPRRVSMLMTFCLFLFSFFSCLSPLALVTIIGSIVPPRYSLPISLFGCAIPSSFPLLFTISKFGLPHVFLLLLSTLSL